MASSGIHAFRPADADRPIPVSASSTDPLNGNCARLLASWLPYSVDVSSSLPVRGSISIPRSELRWRFSRSSGPGGQGVNTADSRVELLWDLANSDALPPALKARALDRLAGRLVDGVLSV